MSPILVTLTLHRDSNFERSNVSFKENKPDDVDPNFIVSTVAFKRKKKSTVLGRLRIYFNFRIRLEIGLKIRLRHDRIMTESEHD